MRVLLVDDTNVFRIAMTYILARLGHVAIAVGSASAAIETIAKESEAGRPIDLIITDFSMPETNGVELLNRLHAAGCRIPAILYSMDPLEAIEKACAAKGIPTDRIRHYLSKDDMDDARRLPEEIEKALGENGR